MGSNNCGEKKLVTKGMVPQCAGGVLDNHYTVIPVTNLVGVTVLITIIFAGDQMKASWALGIDALAENISVDEDGIFELGEGKVFPGGPSCFVNGVEIPCLCVCSSNGSVTEEILTQILQKLDEYKLTKRDLSESLYPMLIVDGHGSRLGLQFLSYINELSTKWMVVLGAPCATNLWQVHDDERMNLVFKTESAREKHSRILQKRVAGLAGDIAKEEIVIIVARAVARSFFNEANARHAISDCGWNPPNRNRLLHPQILETAPAEFRDEQVEILRSRGITHFNDPSALPASVRDLAATGSGRHVSNEILAATIETLNHSGVTAQNIHTLTTAHDNRNVARVNNEAKRITALPGRLDYVEKVYVVIYCA